MGETSAPHGSFPQTNMTSADFSFSLEEEISHGKGFNLSVDVARFTPIVYGLRSELSVYCQIIHNLRLISDSCSSTPNFCCKTSFRFHFTMDTLVFGLRFLQSRLAWDLHPIDYAHAWHTKILSFGIK